MMWPKFGGLRRHDGGDLVRGGTAEQSGVDGAVAVSRARRRQCSGERRSGAVPGGGSQSKTR